MNETSPPNRVDDGNETSFAETALRMGGKSADEAKRTGAIDRADDQVEQLFKVEYQTVNSPAHRAVWDRQVPIDLFRATPDAPPPNVRKVMDESIEVVRRRRLAKTVLDGEGRVRIDVLQDLAAVGYWGLLVDPRFGGVGAPFRSFAPFLTRMAMEDPTIAGLASVHGCIGAVDPVRSFGSPEQQARFLPRLASGQSLSAFALTEPGAGSDLTALRTRAERKGDAYVVNGEKLFVTNVVPGNTIGLVCLIDDAPAVLICELPPEENDSFEIRKYGIWALKHTYNRGIVFRDFRVPAANLLTPVKGNGLTIAYHGLNLGRVSLCANAAGTMRVMLANILPWARYRVTYGQAIAKRELVQRRIGRLTGLIVACDALVAWCATLIDAGYRGEMECIIAKIFGSESQKEAAVELFMKTHGGRSFLHGHLFGDNVHEYLAPCIYEGEGEMLGMAFFKSLVKQHGTTYFEPVGRALQEAGIRKPNLMNPTHVWALRRVMGPYTAWLLSQYLTTSSRPTLPPMPDGLRRQAEFACEQLQAARLEISGTMRRHQLQLADRQCRMSELSARVQKMIVILCTSLYASDHGDELVREAAELLCRDLTRDLVGRRPSDRYFRAVTKLGASIADGGFTSIAGVEAESILIPYETGSA
ncbi:MAG: acyl-CoA dehydrogenase [Planctomycetes bacterium]|nr:acyl-CoA dehydrogenase [Planctomycetota bacterium]